MLPGGNQDKAEPSPGAQLLAEIRVYIRLHGLKETQFGSMFARSPSFVGRLKRGQQPRTATIERVREAMRGPPPGRARVSRHTAHALRYRRAVAENAAIEEAARVHRLTDPLEQAKTWLRRKGWQAVSARVLFPTDKRLAGKTLVGSKLMEPDEVIALAERHGLVLKRGGTE